MFYNVFRKRCRLRDNVEKYFTAVPATDDTWRMRIGCRITKAANTHSQYVIIIVFPLQQWLHERAKTLRLYVHRLSCFCVLQCTVHFRGTSLRTVTRKPTQSVHHR